MPTDVDKTILKVVLPQVQKLASVLQAHLKEEFSPSPAEESQTDIQQLHSAYAALDEMLNHLLPSAPKKEVIEARKILPDRYSNAIVHMQQPEKKKKKS